MVLLKSRKFFLTRRVCHGRSRKRLEGKRVLIVDDEPDILETLEALLAHVPCGQSGNL
jgi:hypoxanthine phosphoribosyltransferase